MKLSDYKERADWYEGDANVVSFAVANGFVDSLQAELDAYKAHVAGLTKMMYRFSSHKFEYYPGCEDIGDDVDELLAKTPAQSLRTIQAQAVTDLISECSYSTQVNGIATSIIDVDSAISYADRLGEG